MRSRAGNGEGETSKFFDEAWSNEVEVRLSRGETKEDAPGPRGPPHTRQHTSCLFPEEGLTFFLNKTSREAREVMTSVLATAFDVVLLASRLLGE